MGSRVDFVVCFLLGMRPGAGTVRCRGRIQRVLMTACSVTAISLAAMLAWAGAAAADSSLSWSAPTLVDHQPPFGGPAAYSGVSCPTASFCVAVGWADDGWSDIATSTDPTGGPSAWKVVSQVDYSSLLSDISCPSPSLCVGIDAAGDVVTSTDPTGGANAWTITQIDGRRLNGISCPSTSLCVVTDDSGNLLTSTDPTGGAGTWTKTTVDAFNALPAVSCPSTSFYVAVDDSGNVFTSTDPTGGASPIFRVMKGQVLPVVARARVA